MASETLSSAFSHASATNGQKSGMEGPERKDGKDKGLIKRGG